MRKQGYVQDTVNKCRMLHVPVAAVFSVPVGVMSECV